MIIKTIKINKINMLVLALTLIIILCFIFIYNIPKKNNDLKKLDNSCSYIEKCNYNLKDGLDDNTINIKAASSIICDNIVNLNDTLSDLDDLNIESVKYQNQKENLKNTIKSNIELLELSNNLINNNSYDNINNSFSKYSDTLNSVINGYKTLGDDGLHIVFPNNALKFFNSVYNYGNTLIKISRDTDIVFDQTRSFSINLKNSICTLDEISENLEPVLVDIYDNNRSLDSLSKDVQTKKSKILKLKYQIYNFTVPNECTEYYTKLKETINSYEMYITSFESALSTHKSSINKFDMSDIYANYKDSLSKYKDYTNTLNELKDNSKKINN